MHIKAPLSILLTCVGLICLFLTGCTHSSPNQGILPEKPMPLAITPCQKTWREYQQLNKAILEKAISDPESDLETESVKLQSFIPQLEACAHQGEISQADLDAMKEQSEAAVQKLQNQMQAEMQKAMHESAQELESENSN